MEQKSKPSQAADTGKSKETEEETKGRVRETEGRQRDTSLANKAAVTNLSGHSTDCLRRRNRDSQRYLKAKTVWGRESKAMGRGTTRHGAAGQDDLCSIVNRLSIFEPQTEAKHNSNTCFTH